MVDQIETASDFGKDRQAPARRWLAEIKSARKYFQQWEDRGKAIVKRYRAEDDALTHGRTRFNILWSNIETLKPILYSRQPKADVQRRFKDKDQTARVAAEVVERVLDSLMDAYDFDGVLKAARDDYLLVGRGQVWLRYSVDHGDPLADTETGATQTYEDGAPVREILREKVMCDHIQWSSFLHSPAPSWDKVTWVAREELMTRDQLVERFPEHGNDVPLDVDASGLGKVESASYGDVFKRAKVVEIWDKPSRKVIWIAPSYARDVLDRADPPLDLEGFFPCPAPIYATMTTGSTVPVPDYDEYEGQARELDRLTSRIFILAEALQLRGIYPDEFGEEIQNLLGKPENELIPVNAQQYMALIEKGGLEKAIQFVPIRMVAEVLTALLGARQQAKQDLYEITGLSDIIRGASQKEETATAQRIKSNFVGLRVEERQRHFARFVRDILRIKAEIAVERFRPETLAEMANWPGSLNYDPALFAQAMALLKNERLRGFRVDIETDSTVAPDKEREQSVRVEFATMVGSMIRDSIPAMQQNAALLPLISETMMFVVRGFTAGRQLEQTFEEAIQKIAQGQQNQPADPKAIEAQGRMQIEGARIQIEQQKAAAQVQAEQAKIQNERDRLALERMRLEFEMQEAQAEAARTGQVSQADIQKIVADIQAGQAEAARKDRELQLRAEEIETKRIDTLARIDIDTGRDAFDRDLKDRSAVRNEDAAMLMQMMQAMAEGFQQIMAQTAQTNAEAAQRMEALAERMAEQTATVARALTAPKKVIRGKDGKATGVAVDMGEMENMQ